MTTMQPPKGIEYGAYRCRSMWDRFTVEIGLRRYIFTAARGPVARTGRVAVAVADYIPASLLRSRSWTFTEPHSCSGRIWADASFGVELHPDALPDLPFTVETI